ncbi:MAG TPA: TnsA endonuclease N-terminal domain-containing protein, partial [Ktedonobacteraceae bacterium]|nr:TnsA endonuclease N-terminal domain-containing protein [Ktedonobacteraceae bacterium]
MPVRNVSNHGGNMTGAIPSRKLGRMVHFESLTERAYIYLLEHDDQVTRYEEQPCTIHYHVEEQRRRYTPDFAVSWTEGLPSL